MVGLSFHAFAKLQMVTSAEGTRTACIDYTHEAFHVAIYLMKYFMMQASSSYFVPQMSGGLCYLSPDCRAADLGREVLCLCW